MGWLQKDDRNLTDYERFHQLSPTDTLQNRDVYNGQQPGRTRLHDKQSPVSRHLFAAGLSILVMFIIWMFISVISFVVDGGLFGQSLMDPTELGFGAYLMKFTFGKFMGTLSLGFLFFLVMDVLLMRNKDAQDALSTTEDINQYENDQHIAYPEEIQRKFDYFPDVGATSDVQFSSMISHIALSNKGLKTVMVAKRAKQDIVDEDGEVVLYKGEILRDDDGNVELEEVPLIDEPFMDSLFEASGLPADPRRNTFRIFYDTRKIPYNPGNKNREKLQNKDKPYNTVADLINADWQVPYYEPQRPGGAYLVDTAPVNTMVLAITRAGKGQTYIEPVLDMWTRERRPNNMVINDPKGELLVKYYVRGTVRGFQIIQFNLINAMKTDIYNPLCLAADAAREGDFTKAALYVENIADVFFPLDGGEDPVWPNAANNAFKRSAYGMIDYYLEEERELRAKALRTNMDEKILETKLDEMWGKVTLYNTYQLFVQLTSRKRPNPAVQFQKDAKNRKFDNLSDDEYNELCESVKLESKIWDDNPEADELTLFFNATAMLPTNSMRRLVLNADNALKSMGAAEKMLASVYGIAITAMSFFTDPTISTLTSGTPSQNADLPGLSFPRCFGIRFHSEYLKKYHLIGMQCRWSSYKDKDFTMDMGPDFYHEDMISREGWAKYYFKGKYDRDYAYVQCRIVNPQTGQYIHTYRFQFRKSYQTSLDARYYVTDPVLGDKIVKNGVLIELQPRNARDGRVVYRRGKTTFKQEKIEDVLTSKRKSFVDTNAIVQTSVRYSEKPKMIFLVTPPHLMKYAKLILILVKQLVDLNFDKSYMTKSNQKPLYKTRFMLDELGNLQSEGHGISGLQTMLSIGLGQEQQFTLILQTLQQLRDVYGDSVDKVIQGNTSNIVFLKSTDDSMLDTLQKMSGTTHKSFIDTKNITVDKQRLFMQNESKLSYTMTTKEVPVIMYNDMAFISERNSIVFRAGDAPVWNRNQTILPMSWRLFKNTIVHAGHDYSLQTIPTLSSALDFDVRKNQPDFNKMLEKRMAQAKQSKAMQERYQEAYDRTDAEIMQMDPDVWATEIMALIDEKLVRDQRVKSGETDADGYDEKLMPSYSSAFSEVNKEQLQANAVAKQQQQALQQKIYAGGMLSRDELVSQVGVNHQLDDTLKTAFIAVADYMLRDGTYFMDKHDGSLYGVDGTPYIVKHEASQELNTLNQMKDDKNSRVFAEAHIAKEDVSAIGSYQVTDAFYRFLVKLDRWTFAEGRFDSKMNQLMNQ